MDFITSIILILCGCFACYHQIAAKKPGAAQLLDKIAPYKGYLGLITLVVGLAGLVNLAMSIPAMNLIWVISFCLTMCATALGFLLSYELLHKHLLQGNPNTDAKTAELHAKLIGKQVFLGYIGIAMGLFSIVSPIIM